jgi:IS4 transposase
MRMRAPPGHEVADEAKAWQIVAWYQARWTIEQLFRVMKSQGLQPEDSQLASADRLVKLAAVASTGPSAQ